MTNQDYFNQAIKAVNSGRYNLNDKVFQEAALYLAKELKYRPDQDLRNKLNQKAIDFYRRELNDLVNDKTLDKADHDKYFSELVDIIHDRNNPVYTPEFTDKVNKLRQVYTVIHYINFNNLK
jgi:hypothetical protein